MQWNFDRQVRDGRPQVKACFVWQMCASVAGARIRTMKRNLEIGTVMGKTQACASSAVAWLFGPTGIPDGPLRVVQIHAWFS